MTKKIVKQQHPLVGQYFLTYVEKDGKINRQWQGCVLEVINDDTLIVQLYEWILGNPSTRQLVPIVDTLTEQNGVRWDFFPDRDSWLDWVENHPEK
jgi:hypothetical protein